MKLSSDVNTIFAYDNPSEELFSSVVFFLNNNRRRNYYLLSEVKSSFIFTYSNYLKESCLCVEKSIINFKANRKSKSKLSPFALRAIINKKTDESIKKVSKEKYFRYGTIRKFVNKLLTEYSVISLYNDPALLSEFREKYLTKAEDEALDVLNRFLKIFKDFHCLNLEDYDSFNKWFTDFKKVDLNLFKNKKDNEDMRIAAEIFSFDEKYGKIRFVTGDKEFHKSLNKAKKHFGGFKGFFELLKPNKPQQTNLKKINKYALH